MRMPVDVTEDALRLAQRANTDCLVALGGSAIGLAKALALRTSWQQIAIPTTYSDFEVRIRPSPPGYYHPQHAFTPHPQATPIAGQTENCTKTTVRAIQVLSRVILYDVALTLSLPIPTSVVSGLNAIAHAVEALYSPDSNPITDALAEQGLRKILHALPAIRAQPLDDDARSQALIGAWLCGSCLSAVRMGLHHKLCHILGPSSTYTPT
jgi:maleylacetate reductase